MAVGSEIRRSPFDSRKIDTDANSLTDILVFPVLLLLESIAFLLDIFIKHLIEKSIDQNWKSRYGLSS